MNKYINADEYRKILNGESNERTYCINENAYDDGLDRGLGIAIDILDEMPAADVVEIVRCKDCKNSVCIGERHYCDIQYDEWGQPYVVKPDGYCDCGEREETNDM